MKLPEQANYMFMPTRGALPTGRGRSPSARPEATTVSSRPTISAVDCAGGGAMGRAAPNRHVDEPDPRPGVADQRPVREGRLSTSLHALADCGSPSDRLRDR